MFIFSTDKKKILKQLYGSYMSLRKLPSQNEEVSVIASRQTECLKASNKVVFL